MVSIDTIVSGIGPRLTAAAILPSPLAAGVR
jgi:hypothetical protein